MTELIFERLTPGEAKSDFDDLLNLYLDVYSVAPYLGDPFFSVTAAQARLESAFAMKGFEVVTARHDEKLVGFVHGVSLTPDKPWWINYRSTMPKRIVESVVNGQVFWLRELLVRDRWRNRGIGRRLHDAMVAGRTEPSTALTCIPDNQPAHDAYIRWGYKILGHIKHAPESPLYDAMLLTKDAKRMRK